MTPIFNGSMEPFVNENLSPFINGIFYSRLKVQKLKLLFLEINYICPLAMYAKLMS